MTTGIHPKKKFPSRSRGVSSVIGMAIFLLLFAIAVSYVFTWTQNQGTYVNTINTQTNLDRNRLSESLTVSAINDTALNVQNPTSSAAVVTQIWSNNSEIWSGDQGISPYGNYTFTLQTVSGWNNTALNLSNGNFEIVTLNGNIFSGGVQSQLLAATADTWNVSWYCYNTTAGMPSKAMSVINGAYLGNSYWYDLNFNWQWSAASNPGVANANISATSSIGFVATTTVMATTNSNFTIYYNDTNSIVQFVVDGQNQSSATNSIVCNNNLQYSMHTITVYYLMNTTGINNNNIFSYVTSLQLYIFNATFAP